VEPNPVAAAPAPRGRSTGKIVAATVGAVAIVAAGVFAITRLAGDASASGGADSPEAAADMLLDALDDEDVLGAVDVLLPGERETFREPLQDMVSELQRLEVLSDDDLSGVSGIDIVVTDRNVASTPTNVDDIVNLDVTATVASSVDGAALPIGDWIRENVEADEIDSIDETSEPTEGRFPVTAVRQDGRWYLSLFYTAAEQARAQTDLEIPAEGVPLNGGDSPEAAMDHALAALADLDLAGLVGTLNPDEFEALQRYAPLFLDDAQRQLDDSVSESGVSIEVRDTAYTVDGEGARRGVTITAMAVDVTAEGETLTARLEDGCFLVQVPDQDEVSSCELTEQLDDALDLDDVVDDPQAVEDAIADVQAAFEEYENPGVIVQEVDGSWYLSPLATISEQVLAVVGALDRGEIEDLTAQLQDLAGTFDPDMVVGGVEVPDFDDFELPGDDAPSKPDADDPANTIVAETVAPDDSQAPEDTVEGAAFPDEACYEESDVAAAQACFEDLLASGDIEPEFVPWYFRFPECDAAATMWSDDLYGLPDDEFVAAIEALQPCVQGLIASGVAADYEFGEVGRPQCLDGQNPYLLDVNSDEFEVFTSCVYG
jgi:hypothetical protein